MDGILTDRLTRLRSNYNCVQRMSRDHAVDTEEFHVLWSLLLYLEDQILEVLAVSNLTAADKPEARQSD